MIEWLAGVIEVAGNVRHNGSTFTIEVKSTDEALLDYLHEVYGGHRRDGRWAVYGDTAKRYIAMLEPLLVGKKKAIVSGILEEWGVVV